MNSPEHRKNILDEGYTDIGIGVAVEDTILSITQNFAGISGVRIDSILIESNNGKYMINIFSRSFLMGISVFVNEKPVHKDEYELFDNYIRIPLNRKSGSHKIEFCHRDGGMYKCKIRLFLNTDYGWRGLLPPQKRRKK